VSDPDLAGQEKFKTITQTFYKGASGVIFTYDVNSKESFQQITKFWMPQVHTHGGENVRKMLIGNKTDVPNRVVTEQEGKELAERCGMKFFETSALEDVNVTEAFYELVKDIKVTILDKSNGEASGGIKLTTQENNRNQQSSCC